MSHMPTAEPTSSDLPPLSDEAAVQILEFLHELLFRFEARYFAQIRRFHHEQRDLFERAPSPSYDSLSFDDDLPF